MGDGSTPIIVFLNGSTTGSEIVWAKEINYTSPDVAYDFVPTDGDTIPNHYTNTGTGTQYEYSYTPPTPPVLPNPVGLIAALQSDTTVQPIYFLLAPYEYTISNYNAGNAAAIKAIWAELISQYGSTILTSTLQATIEGYATTYNCPLA